MNLKFKDPKRTRLGYQLAVLSFGSFRNILLLTRDMGGMSVRYVPRGLFVFATSLLTIPLRLYESARYGRAIRKTTISPEPVFVVGHWRSGTTHLHNLLCLDPQLGYVSMYQAIVPDFSLIAERILKPILSRFIPLVRPMDNMVWPLDFPQEEEIPLSKIFPYGYYARLLFPRKVSTFFEKFVLMRGASEDTIVEFRQHYLKVLRKAAFRCSGRRLVLKNPVNTGRIKLLLELFPDAKFVHIHRNPYEVFVSTRHLHKTLLEIIQLDDISPLEIDENILSTYTTMVGKYLEERGLIPAGNLVEVSYRELVDDTLGSLQRIYSALGLPGFEIARPEIERYVNSQKDYKRNEYVLDEETAERVTKKWGFAFAEWGYSDRLDTTAD